MVRQRDNVGVYKVVSKDTKRIYYVELIGLQNNYYGQSRFEAHIIRTDLIEQYDYCGAYVYRFTGHCAGNEYEADWIVQYHEKKIERTQN